MTDHIRRKNEITGIPDAETRSALIEKCALSEKDKKFLRMVYVDRISVAAAGDMVGFYGRSATRHIVSGTLAMWLVLHRMRM